LIGQDSGVDPERAFGSMARLSRYDRESAIGLFFIGPQLDGSINGVWALGIGDLTCRWPLSAHFS
jgi:hypothetical protein